MQCGNEIIKKNNESFTKFQNKKFCCKSCSITYSNLHKKKKDFFLKKCLNCGIEIPKKKLSLKEYNKRKFCCSKCSKQYEHNKKIEAWKKGEFDGAKGINWLTVSHSIRVYLFEKYDNKCSKCGWGKVNPYTGRIPLEIDHIDGDATNNKEENLVLLCPNCHSLTSTYCGANKGKGKRNIAWVPKNKLIK